MVEFWEEAFKDKQEMWGSAPSKSAVLTIEEEFGHAGLMEVTTVNENYPFHLIKCNKKPRA